MQLSDERRVEMFREIRAKVEKITELLDDITYDLEARDVPVDERDEAQFRMAVKYLKSAMAWTEDAYSEFDQLPRLNPIQ